MKLWEVFRFELTYHARRVSTWIYFALFVALAFWMTTGLLVDEAQRAGEVHANAPIAITVATIFISMMGMLVTAALFGDAATRDIKSRMHPLFFTLSLSKADYLGGRFLGTLVVNSLLLAAVPLGFILAAQMPFLEADLFGPFRAAAYLQPYLLFALPNLLVTSVILFAMAALTRRALASYAGVLLLFLGSMLSEEVLAEQMARGELGSLLDPFGFTMMSELWAYWTAFEKNTQLIDLEGILLWNRLIWVAVAVGVLAFTFFRFRFTHHKLGHRRRRRDRPRTAGAMPERRAPVAVPQVSLSFDFKTRMRQMLAVTRRSLQDIVVSRVFLAVAVGAIILVLTLGWQALDDSFGTPSWPLTQLVARLLGGFLIGISISLLTAFFAGELVWRERDLRLSEITDATPIPDFVLFAGKFLALGLVLILLQTVLMSGGILLQALQGHFHFELALYIKILFGLQLADYLLFAVLAMLVHVVVDHKYLGHLIVLLFYVFTVFAGRLGVEHNLLVYGADPGWVYSDMSGFGPFLGPWLWFKLYWGAWALLLAVATNFFWVRGRERGMRHRIQRAGRRFTRPAATLAAVGVVLLSVTGGFIFYNTNILNDYRTGFEQAERRAEYERRYGQYEGAPQPQLTGTKLHIEIYPVEREVEVRGTYQLENRTAMAIDSVHLFVHPDVETQGVEFDRPARAMLEDEELGHRIYVLDQQVQPGDSLQLRFDVLFKPRGFPNRGINTSVVGNGTYFDHTGGRNPNHRRWLPLIGYQPNLELTGEAARREHGIGPRPGRSLDDLAGRHDVAGREPIDFEAIIGTVEEQIAVAPGALRETWTENGRSYFRYETEAPVKNAYAILSADYEVLQDRWEDVEIQVFHHPTHTYNLDRMVQSVKASLDYHTEHFGPYPHRQIRIAEFPRYANLAHAYPGTITFAEGFGFLARVDDEQHLDTPFTVVAHEVAHQWWGSQVVPAAVEGGPVLSEVLAQYSAMMVTENTYGPEPVRRFLRVLHQEYLNRRTSRDVPLLRVRDHSNIFYRKGALAMYALREYVGEEQVNRALRRLLQEHGSGEPPYPTSLDLYEELQAVTPDSLQYLLEDFFEENTLWGLQATDARAEPTGTGEWRVTLDVVARKVEADSTGREIEVPMDDWVEIGIFAAGEGRGLGEPLHLEKHRIRPGEQQITVTVPQEPARAGIDPYHLLIDRSLEDNTVNIKDVTGGGGVAVEPS